MSESLTPSLLLDAYAQGFFPMARAEDDPQLYWFCPEMRGVMPLDERFHISRSLRKLMRKKPFRLSLNEAFPEVIEACRENRQGSWINDPIIALYTELHRLGYAHSLECWQKDRLVGGIYGVALGGAFFGESMFSRVSGASKIALVTLQSMLCEAGYVLFDVQYENDHLQQFGVLEIPRASYLYQLDAALGVSVAELELPI